MKSAKVAISLDPKILKKLDHLVKRRRFLSRSHAVQISIEEKLERMEKRRLAEECAELDPREERAFADLGLDSELELWPKY